MKKKRIKRDTLLDRQKLARYYQRAIQDLKNKEDKLYEKALKKLKITDEDDWAFDFFFNRVNELPALGIYEDDQC